MRDTHFVDYKRLNDVLKPIRKTLSDRIEAPIEGVKGQNVEMARLLGIAQGTFDAMISANVSLKHKFSRTVIERMIRNLRELAQGIDGLHIAEDFAEQIILREPRPENSSPEATYQHPSGITRDKRVGASQSILDITWESQEDSCVVPPGHELRFMRARTVHWTNDPFDHIEKTLADDAIVFPWNVRRHHMLSESELKSWSAEVDRYLEFAVRNVLQSFPQHDVRRLWQKTIQVDALVDEAAEAARKTKTNLPECLFKFIPYAAQFKAILTKLRPVEVFVPREPEEFRQTAGEFWKRARGLYFEEKYQSEPKALFQILGPYYGADGNIDMKHPMSPDYPLRTSHPACLLVIRGDYDAAGNWRQRGIQPFFDPHHPEHRVRNTTASPIFCWFRINDDRPGDNGDGYCEVEYEVAPI